MHPERAPISEELFPDSTERTDSANDTGPERKRSPEFKIDENREGETPEEDAALKEKEPTFEELALGIAMEKHGGRADEWKPNNDFAEWNKNYIREDGEIVDHRGIPVMESAMKDPKGTESVEFKRFVEVQEYLKNEANIGVPIYSGDYIRVENGKEIYQVTSAVRRENGEIEYMPLEYAKELSEENVEDETLQGKTEEERVDGEEISVPFVTIEDDGSMSVDLTAAFEAELEEVSEKDEVAAETATIESFTPPVGVFMVEEKVLAEEMIPQTLAFKTIENNSVAQETASMKAVEQIIEVVNLEVVPESLTLRTEIIADEDTNEVLQKESIVPETLVIVEPEFTKQEESISLVSAEEGMRKEVTSVIEAESIPVISDEIKKEQVEQKNEVLLAATKDALEENVLVTEVASPQIQQSVKDTISEIVISEAFVEPTTSIETIQSIQMDTRENIKAEEKYVELKESISAKEEVVAKIIEETKQEKGEVETEAKVEVRAEVLTAGHEEVKVISEDRTERTVEFIPPFSVEESNSRSKESPFVVYENELQLRETTERTISAQESERPFAGIPDSSMSPANAAVAANDNTEETRASAPVTSEEVTQNGITLNLRDAA